METPPVTWRAWPPRDRRFHHRSPLTGRAAVRTEGATIVGRCLDVSLGGFALETDVELPIGHDVEVTIQLDPSRIVSASGEVVRRVGSKLGIRFTRLGRRTFDAILAHLNEQFARSDAVG